jgi:hypothetical protein
MRSRSAARVVVSGVTISVRLVLAQDFVANAASSRPSSAAASSMGVAGSASRLIDEWLDALMPAINDNSPAPAPDAETGPALDAEMASRSLRRGLISLAALVAVVVSLVLAVPGLHGVGLTVAHM